MGSFAQYHPVTVTSRCFIIAFILALLHKLSLKQLAQATYSHKLVELELSSNEHVC
jgi:hypothetical protein